MGHTWSAYQQAIFQDAAHGEGHTEIMARAGSGKTTVIVESLQHVPRAERKLLCAFNRSIRAELAERAPRGTDVVTLNGLGFRALRDAFGEGLTVDEDKLHVVVEGLTPGWEAEHRAELRRAVGLAKATLAGTAREVLPLLDVFDIRVPEQQEHAWAALVVRALDRCAENPRFVDFDDQIWLPLRLGLRVRQYDRVLVDEAQDLSRAQLELTLRALAPRGRLCAVGDDRQAIYGWRGADTGAMDRIRDRLGAKTLPLSVTYRCPRRVVELAREVVPDLEAAPGAADGQVKDVEEEDLQVDAAPGDFVLARKNAPLVALTLRFLSEGRPAAMAGRDIGRGLAALARKSKADDVAGMLRWLATWEAAEVQRLVEKGRDPSGPSDRAACLRTLARGAVSVQEVCTRIERLFDDRDSRARITMSSVHRAKGLERDRVWVLEETFGKNSLEEENLWYVAITRARRDLRIVREAA